MANIYNIFKTGGGEKPQQEKTNEVVTTYQQIGLTLLFKDNPILELHCRRVLIESDPVTSEALEGEKTVFLEDKLQTLIIRQRNEKAPLYIAFYGSSEFLEANVQKNQVKLPKQWEEALRKNKFVRVLNLEKSKIIIEKSVERIIKKII